MDMNIELVTIPTTDVDRAIDFYTKKLEFNLDHDNKINDAVRVVQLTPMGSGCSILIGTNVTEMAPGSQKNLTLVVDNIDSVRQTLSERDVIVSDVQEFPWGKFIYINDPDENTLAIQQKPKA